MRHCDSWVRGLSSRGLRNKAIIVDRKPASRTAFHLGFYYFPTNLHLHMSDKDVPDWNRWNPNMPEHFFKISRQYLADDGFLEILHSGQFARTQTIYAAIGDRAMFCVLQSYSVIVPVPFWKANSNIQVGSSFSFEVSIASGSCWHPVWTILVPFDRGCLVSC